MTDYFPRLCGGTFLTLLLREKRHKSKKQLQQYGSDGLAQRFLFKQLILLINPNFEEGYGTSFETHTSLYKACKRVNADYFPFDNDALLSAFDRNIKNSYKALLKQMGEIVDTYLVVESEPQIQRLVYALLNLIKDDRSTNGAEFYAIEDGSSVSKTDLLNASEINLPAFLLGIWHFIAMNRKDNEIGFDTLSHWQGTPETKGQIHSFEVNVGASYTHDIKISTTCEIADDAITENIEEPVIEIIDSVSQNTETQKESINQSIINNQFIFNQNGNGINIGQATNVVIKNGKVVDVE